MLRIVRGLPHADFRPGIAVRPAMDSFHIVIEGHPFDNIAPIPRFSRVFPSEHEVCVTVALIFDEKHDMPP
jgi:hypothetical protein